MMQTKHAYPLVSIITVNFNQASATGEFLSSIQQITYPNTEIIVVDNASREPGFEILKESFTNVTFINNPINKGFAGGNNTGIAVAKGKYLLFINNDTEVDKDFLEHLVACMETDATIGMVSPKIKFYFKKNTIQYAGGKRINPFTGRGKFIGSGLPDSAIYDCTYPTQLIHGAAMMVSRGAIEKAGLMEESFFLYYEELDWCERVKKAGFTLCYVGQSVVYHKESLSVGKDSPLKIYYLTRNRLLFTIRNYDGFQLWISLLFFSLISFPKSLVAYMLKGNFSLLKAFIKGAFWHIYPKPAFCLTISTSQAKTNKPTLT